MHVGSCCQLQLLFVFIIEFQTVLSDPFQETDQIIFIILSNHLCGVSMAMHENVIFMDTYSGDTYQHILLMTLIVLCCWLYSKRHP